jgi:iron complex transport system ATP-binding protein
MLMQTRHLTAGYGNNSVIDNVRFLLHRGEWVSIVGANGSGKSTLLKCLSKQLSPRRGSVVLDGKSIHRLSPKAIAKKLALVPQHQDAPEGLTVNQLVEMGRTPYQAWWQWDLDWENRSPVEAALVQTQMRHLRDRPLSDLSGGERQRAFLALALAQDPQVLLLDEPTTFLDIRYQLELLELLKGLNQDRGLSVVTVLHDINLAARYSDRLALMHNGKIWDTGTPEQVLTPSNIASTFGVEVAIAPTPVGLQIIPLYPCSDGSNGGDSHENSSFLSAVRGKSLW